MSLCVFIYGLWSMRFEFVALFFTIVMSPLFSHLLCVLCWGCVMFSNMFVFLKQHFHYVVASFFLSEINFHLHVLNLLTSAVKVKLYLKGAAIGAQICSVCTMIAQWKKCSSCFSVFFSQFFFISYLRGLFYPIILVM